MKLLAIPKNTKQINDKVDGIIIGLKGLSVNYQNSLSLEEIKKLKTTKEIFVVINKIIFNSDLQQLETSLVELSKSNIKGIMFYDLSILSINNRLNLKLNLVWNQTHMVTNYNTCNYYYKKGVKGAYLANELTLEEMIQIKEQTLLETYVNIISKPAMAHSRRTLITNYFKNMNKEKKKDMYEIAEKISGHKYLINEEKDGTTIIYNNIVNGIKPLFELKKINFDYVIIDETYLDDELSEKGIDLIRNIIENKINEESAISYAQEKFGEDTGFFYKKTIYKVK